MLTAAAASIILLLCPISSALKPPHELQPNYESSRALTRGLLDLDLGYSILNNEAILRRRSAFVDDDYEYINADDEDGGEYWHLDEVYRGPFSLQEDESLPVSISAFPHREAKKVGGPNPEGFWIDSDFWGRSPFHLFGGSNNRPPPRRPLRRPPPRPHHHQNQPPAHFFEEEIITFRPPKPKRRPQHGPPRRNKDKIAFVGDQHQCSAGSCEFFLFCWLSGGVIEGGCGGFLFACCQRPRSIGSDVIVARVSPSWQCDIRRSRATLTF